VSDPGEFRFTFDRYRALLDRLRDADAEFRRFDGGETTAGSDSGSGSGPASAPDPDAADATTGGPTVYLRHDVDWSPRKARRLAAIEADRGVTATYFFLVSATAYNPLDGETRAAIEAIAAAGHAVGLHVDLRDVDDPTVDAVGERIGRQRPVLAAAGVDPSTAVSFHNPPEWVIGRRLDRDLGVVNAYAPRFVERATYAADSNQRWRADPPLSGALPGRLQLLTHPVLWGERDGWTTDRLREERDYHEERLARSLARTDRTWDGPRGLGEAFDGDDGDGHESGVRR
jgi:peptidoglycan/xylan/chitin deacetylase (PgdA/CDA1 family)